MRNLLANAMGHQSWMRAAPNPYSLASVCMITGLSLLKYARVVLRRELHM